MHLSPLFISISQNSSFTLLYTFGRLVAMLRNYNPLASFGSDSAQNWRRKLRNKNWKTDAPLPLFISISHLSFALLYTFGRLVAMLGDHNPLASFGSESAQNWRRKLRNKNWRIDSPFAISLMCFVFSINNISKLKLHFFR